MYLSLTPVFGSLATAVQSTLGLIILTMNFEYNFVDKYFVYKPWRLYLQVTSSLALVCLIMIHFLPESPQFLLARKRKDEALQVLQKMYRINNGNTEKVNVTLYLYFLIFIEGKFLGLSSE